MSICKLHPIDEFHYSTSFYIYLAYLHSGVWLSQLFVSLWLPIKTFFREGYPEPEDSLIELLLYDKNIMINKVGWISKLSFSLIRLPLISVLTLSRFWAWVSTDDAWVSTVNTWVSTDDAWVSTVNTWVSTDDAWVSTVNTWVSTDDAWFSTVNTWVRSWVHIIDENSDVTPNLSVGANPHVTPNHSVTPDPSVGANPHVGADSHVGVRIWSPTFSFRRFLLCFLSFQPPLLLNITDSLV